MKKFLNIALGMWCAITCFVSPIWLTLAIANLTGLIYKYDYSMDEGTAWIIGIVLLGLWMGLIMFPNVVFIKKHMKYLSIIIVFVVLLCLLCLEMCNWNVMSFLFSPRGI